MILASPSPRGPRLTARFAAQAVLAAGYVLMLAVNLPGHLSTDSVMSLFEGRHGTRESWGPPTYSWILGGFDRVTPGTALFVAASGALFYGSLLSLTLLRPRLSWWAPLAALVLVLLPTTLIYQGVVWKDVLFANLVLAGFILLVFAQRALPTTPRFWGIHALAAAALALACLTRQNGFIVLPFAAVAAGFGLSGRPPMIRFGFGLAQLAVVAILVQMIGWASTPRAPGPGTTLQVGLRILQHYDILGATAHEPGMRLREIDAVNPQLGDEIRHEKPGVYSPERVDFLDRDPGLVQLWTLSDAEMSRQWRELILEHPRAYLAHRLDVFRWVFATPDIDRCLPVFVGVGGPANMLADLRLAAGDDRFDGRLRSYGGRFLRTPAFSHVSSALLALAAAAVLLRRGGRESFTLAMLLLAALAFAASFAVISIACDYRYLYLLDVAALAGGFYLSLGSRRAEIPAQP